MKGARGPAGKLKPEDVREIRAVAKANRGTRRPWRKQLAREKGVSPLYIGDVAAGRSYRWVK